MYKINIQIREIDIFNIKQIYIYIHINITRKNSQNE